MTRIPFAALALGIAGLVPFLYGALMIFAAEGALPTFGIVPATRAGGVLLLEGFGAAILGFMGGCLWGFASMRPQGPSLLLLGASAIPPALAFLALQETPALSCIWLAAGFAVLQGLDVVFHRAGVAPAYWLTLRLPLTAVVILCLLIGALYG